MLSAPALCGITDKSPHEEPGYYLGRIFTLSKRLTHTIITSAYASIVNAVTCRRRLTWDTTVRPVPGAMLCLAS